MPKIKVEMEISKNELRDLLNEDHDPGEDFFADKPEFVTGDDEILALLDQADEKQAKKKQRAAKATTEKPKSAKKKKPTKKEIQIAEMAAATALPENYHIVWSEQQLIEMCDWLRQQPSFAVDTETLGVNPFKDRIVGVSVYAPDRGYYIPLMHNEHVRDIPDEGINGIDYVHCLPNDLVAAALRPILENWRSVKILTHNGKFDCHVLYQWLGIEYYPFFDTMIGQACLDENQSKRLKDMSTLYLKIPSDRFSTLFGSVTFEKIPIRLNPITRTGCLSGFYAIKDTFLTWEMAMFQGRALNRPGMEKIKALIFDEEMPFLQVVTKAERRGVRLDSEYMEEKVAKVLRREVEELRRKIWTVTGEINLNAPHQVAEVLYEKLKLPRVNDKKPNSTDKGTLSKLKKHHDVVKYILEYKQKIKLVTAFADKLPLNVVDGRIHTSFGQVGTKTGRMSSSGPNLQQIPSRIGNLIRNAFIAEDGRLLASIDFGSQELRWLAHVSQDETLLKIYKDGLDVHSMTGSGIWNQNHPNDMVTYEEFEYRRGIVEHFVDQDGNLVDEKFSQEHIDEVIGVGVSPALVQHDVELGKMYEKARKSAKTINFGIVYGMSEYKLADSLDISVEEARSYIKAYFDRYPGVKRWMAEQRKKMDQVGYTNTCTGRKRRVHAEMDPSAPFWLRQRGYRQGINAIIQGSSAEQTKLASLALQDFLASIDAYIVLWVHDEIIFDVPENVGMENLQKIADIMCNVIQLDCGMKSDIEVGRKWGQKMSKDDIDDLFEDDDEDTEDAA